MGLQLTDKQCRIFLRSLREFGYPDLTLSEVEKVADDIAKDRDVSKNVIGVLMKNLIDDATRMANG